MELADQESYLSTGYEGSRLYVGRDSYTSASYGENSGQDCGVAENSGYYEIDNGSLVFWLIRKLSDMQAIPASRELFQISIVYISEVPTYYDDVVCGYAMLCFIRVGE